jgi:hypothetical protein
MPAEGFEASKSAISNLPKRGKRGIPEITASGHSQSLRVKYDLVLKACYSVLALNGR